MNRRRFLSALLLEGTLLALTSACRPAVSLPFFRDRFASLPPPRPAPAEAEVLLSKAREHDRQMGERHLSPEGLVIYRVREEGPPTLSLADAAIWTGCYVAAEAFRWKVTGEREAAQRLTASLNALHLLLQVTGKQGLPARAFRRAAAPAPQEEGEWHQGEGDYQGYRWLGDVSVDQVDGLFFGYAIAFDLIEEPSLRRQIAEDVAAIAGHLLDHRMQIVDLDGRRTKHGDLGDGFFTEDLNALIALMIMKAACRLTKERRFEEAYRRLTVMGYPLRAAAARDKWWEYLIGTNHSDNNLAFLAFYPLLRREEDPSLLRAYRRGLRRAWQAVRVEANPLFTFIAQALLPGERDDAALRRATETLFYFPDVKRNTLIDRSGRRDLCRSYWRDRQGRLQSCKPVPIQDRPTDSFEWKENPYRLQGGGDGRTRFAGVDYLLPYWMGRYHCFLNPHQ